MKIAIGADHAGYELKQRVSEALKEAGHDVDDLGTDGPGSVDYPDFAHAVAEKLKTRAVDAGVLVCGTGIGMAITANKHKGIRAAVCSDTFSARMAREHNDANVLCIGSRVVGLGLAIDIVTAFVSAKFEGGRHAKRVEKIERLE